MVWHQTDLNKESVQSHQSWDNQEEISENMAKPLQFSVKLLQVCGFIETSEWMHQI